MKTILVCLSFFVAYCCATGLTITDLAANTNNPVSGLLSGPRDSTILYYRVFLPRNASSVAISITQTDNVCDDLVLRGRTGQAPCPDAEDETNSICQGSSWYEYFSTEAETLTFGVDPRTSDEYNRWESNQWIYFGVSKEYSFDDDNNCTFTINSITTTYCAAGTTIAYSGADTQTCTAYSSFSFGTPIVITSSPAGTLYYSTNLPGNSYGRASFWVNSTSSDLTFYAKTGAAPNSGYSGITYDCYDYDYDDEVGGFYIYTFDCVTPIGGNWYYFSVSSDETYSATIIPTLTTCSPSGLGGYNCSAPNTAWSPKSPAAGPFTISTNPSYEYDGYSFNYFHYDVNASLPQNPFTFVFTTSNGDGETYMRYNAFPEYDPPYGYSFSAQEAGIDSEGNPTVTWYVYPSDLVNSARIYWAIETDSDFAMTYSLNGTLSTTGAPTTAAPTTGNTTSDSTVLVASFFLVVAALIATLF